MQLSSMPACAATSSRVRLMAVASPRSTVCCGGGASDTSAWLCTEPLAGCNAAGGPVRLYAFPMLVLLSVAEQQSL